MHCSNDLFSKTTAPMVLKFQMQQKYRMHCSNDLFSRTTAPMVLEFQMLQKYGMHCSNDLFSKTTAPMVLKFQMQHDQTKRFQSSKIQPIQESKMVAVT